ncbi:hypothetical protein P280DRAFT_258413 [Massarina eburnea CBS 473.64]|uniref:Uncharacterized protein n=1 Tax=Massarina eburnea CBS 473.64 TaxID=1395130 RepID=A0A6A6RG40_9PLEO|nr:hypothetical protein P280DRAFT_258413 [Massarina eburnea CBS 473.64]
MHSNHASLSCSETSIITPTCFNFRAFRSTRATLMSLGLHIRIKANPKSSACRLPDFPNIPTRRCAVSARCGKEGASHLSTFFIVLRRSIMLISLALRTDPYSPLHYCSKLPQLYFLSPARMVAAVKRRSEATQTQSAQCGKLLHMPLHRTKTFVSDLHA